MDKFRCSACQINFGTLELFDDHRSLWKIVKDHSTSECWRLLEKKKHPKGECQKLVGKCISPQELGLVEYGDYWTTPEGVAKARRMSEVARRA